MAKMIEEKKGVSKKGVAFTRLTEKAYSPLVIRKCTRFGFPIFVGVIADDNLDTLDDVIVGFMKKPKNLKRWKNESCQDKRNLAGELSETITNHFDHVEGIAITFSIDKMFVASLFGDAMNHFQCKFEYYTLLNMSTNI